MTMVLDNQTFILHRLRDGDVLGIRQAMTLEYKGKSLPAMSYVAAKLAFGSLRRRGLVERVDGKGHQITAAGMAVLRARGLLEEVDTQSLKDSLSALRAGGSNG